MKEPQIIQVPGEPSPRVLRLVLNLGHLLLITLLLSWVFLAGFKGEPYENTWKVMLSQVFAGRAAAVGAGLRWNFSPLFLLYQAAMVDAILMLYIYPTFVRGYQHLTWVPFVGNYLANIHKVALSHKKRMAPYGVAGLMLFVIFPFWSTGCVVGAIVGYLIGLSTLVSLLSVTTGNIAAIALWIWFYDRLQGWNENVALVFLAIIFALAIAGILFARVRRTRKKLEDEEIRAYLEAVKSTTTMDLTGPRENESATTCTKDSQPEGVDVKKAPESD